MLHGGSNPVGASLQSSSRCDHSPSVPTTLRCSGSITDAAPPPFWRALQTWVDLARKRDSEGTRRRLEWRRPRQSVGHEDVVPSMFRRKTSEQVLAKTVSGAQLAAQVRIHPVLHTSFSLLLGRRTVLRGSVIASESAISLLPFSQHTALASLLGNGFQGIIDADACGRACSYDCVRPKLVTVCGDGDVPHYVDSWTSSLDTRDVVTDPALTQSWSRY